MCVQEGACPGLAHELIIYTRTQEITDLVGKHDKLSQQCLQSEVAFYFTQ